MKKILTVIAVFIVFSCFFTGNKMYIEASYQTAHPICKWYLMTTEEQNKCLDSLTAAGEAILMRGADSCYDTIIDHIRYRYVTDK